MSKWMLIFMLVAMPGLALAAGKSGGKKPENSDAKNIDAKNKNIDARVDHLFKSVDTNDDGNISKEEAEQKAPAIAENFDKIDANHDGVLSKKEFKIFWIASEKKRREFSQHLEQADLDKNGMLSREEAEGLPNLSAHFDEIDSNHDGQLVIKEIADYLRAQTGAGNASAPAGTAQ